METKFTVSFDIYNTESVKRLQEEDPDILPSYSVDAAQDLAYNKKQISAAITAGIIQGKSIDHIADDLQSRIETMNRASAIRTARTAITNAQNAGTLASMKRLAALGVEVQKEWMATLDSRTRESHRNLDGERRELDERFSNGLMYPGASGSAKEVYNCRCTMVSYLPRYDSEDEPRVTYSEWTEYKKATGSSSNKINAVEYQATKERRSQIVAVKLAKNLFDKSDPLYIDTYSMEAEPGYTDVCLHGSSDSVQVKVDGRIKQMTAKEFAEYLKEECNYKGENIRLASCSTGKGEKSFAQQLSKELGVIVKAPDDDVYYAVNEGVYFIGSPYMNAGSWRIFKNGVEI